MPLTLLLLLQLNTWNDGLNDETASSDLSVFSSFTLKFAEFNEQLSASTWRK